MTIRVSLKQTFAIAPGYRPHTDVSVIWARLSVNDYS